MTGYRYSRVLRIDLSFQAQSDLHVGAESAGTDTDMVVVRDGQGRCIVPGTSLAGALRARLAGAGDPLDQRMFPEWGSIPPRGATETSTAAASRVLVEDAVPAAEPRLERVTGVGIDRYRGAAAVGVLYDAEVVTAGTRLVAALAVETDDGRLAQDAARLGWLLRDLTADPLVVGSGGSRGRGRLRLVAARARCDDVSGPAGLAAALRRRSVPPASDAADGITAALEVLDDLAAGTEPGLPPRRRMVRVQVSWAADGPIMSVAPDPGRPVDLMPRVRHQPPGEAGGTNGDLVVPLLPGSLLKGVLRSRAQLLERTVNGSAAPRVAADASTGQAAAVFQRQLVEGTPLSAALFGTTDHAGAVTVADCVAERGLDPATYRALVAGATDNADAASIEAVRAAWGAAVVDHVALDRWSGKVAGSAKYVALEPWAVGWGAIDLTIDLDRLRSAVAAQLPDPPDDTAPAAAGNTPAQQGIDAGVPLALLLLTLADLVRGRIPLGYGTSRGYGDLHVTGIRVSGWPDTAGDTVIEPGEGGDRVTPDQLEPLAIPLQKSWCDYTKGMEPASFAAGDREAT